VSTGLALELQHSVQLGPQPSTGSSTQSLGPAGENWVRLEAQYSAQLAGEHFQSSAGETHLVPGTGWRLVQNSVSLSGGAGSELGKNWEKLGELGPASGGKS
jgi:hypothetical protein